jgi:hypothetical protein
MRRTQWQVLVLGAGFLAWVLLLTGTALAEPGDLLQTFVNPGAARFGYAVASVGDKVVVGAPNSSAAFIFDASTGNLLHSLGGGYFFGFSVGQAGDRAVVGAIYAEGNLSGLTYVFNSQTGGLLHTLASPGSPNFGYSVGGLGGNPLVGATNEIGVGEAYMFNGQSGGLLTTFADPLPGTGGCFGYSVSAVGHKVVVGAPYRGTVHVFNSVTGDLDMTLVSPDLAGADYFGYSVAGFGGKILIGAPQPDGSTAKPGAAYLFDAQTGALLQTFSNPNASPGDHFGHRVAAVGGDALVGATRDDTTAVDGGAAYLFDGDTGAPLLSVFSPTPSNGGLFGESVAALGSNIVVSSYDAGGRAYLFEGVPEPATLSLLALGGAMVLRRGRRRGARQGA